MADFNDGPGGREPVQGSSTASRPMFSLGERIEELNRDVARLEAQVEGLDEKLTRTDNYLRDLERENERLRRECERCVTDLEAQVAQLRKAVNLGLDRISAINDNLRGERKGVCPLCFWFEYEHDVTCAFAALSPAP